MSTRERHPVAVTVALCVSCALSGCATSPFVPSPIEGAGFVERSVTQVGRNMTLSAAVIGPNEVQSLLGVDLYAQGIQPVWLHAENRSRAPARIALWSIDNEYFTPFEVAWMNRKSFRKKDRPALELWLYNHGMPRRVPPGQSRSGLVFTHATTGTKGFNVDVYSNLTAESFTFFLPLPGFVPDFMDVDFANLYSNSEIQQVDIDELRSALEAYECCSVDSSGTQTGDPFNVVIVGTGAAVRRSLLRAGWEETGEGSPDTALARTHYYRGRSPDGTFHKSRPDGTERKELRLWLAPLRVEEDLVWLGQASLDLSGGTGPDSFADYRMDPDIDDARMFLAQDFWYSQSLARLALVSGVPPASIDAPAQNFHGAEYFTDGRRVVLFVSETPVAMDETILLQWAAPVPQ